MSHPDVVAFDPGLATGWARLNPGHRFESGQGDWYLVFRTFYETVVMGARPVIICEDFVYTAETLKKSRQTLSTEGIGVLRFLSRRFDCDFHLQTPAAAKQFSTNDKLKRLGWYQPGMGHANDAARHLLLYSAGAGLVRVSDFL